MEDLQSKLIKSEDCKKLINMGEVFFNRYTGVSIELYIKMVEIYSEYRAKILTRWPQELFIGS